MDLTNGIKLGGIVEGFQRGTKHTKEYNLWLIERNAPTPSEKEITDSVPFMQGLYDFSTILGERVYENRTISYQFEIIEGDYQSRKLIQTQLENWLMKDGYSPLYDDHAKGYYYMAKCTGVDIEDTSGGLTVDIEFNAYPFKISILPEGHDIWDNIDFDLDVLIPVEFDVNGSLEVNLLNIGITSVTPKITTNAPMTIQKGNMTYEVKEGITKSERFRLDTGENKLTITGNGHIEFEYRKELI